MTRSAPSVQTTERPPAAGGAAGGPADRADPVLARLTSLHPKLIDLTLDRVHRLLGRLGDPHLALPPVVHVAGTNGKGSTVAFLRAMLEAAGHRVHAYTSPHLVRFHERIRLGGRLIDDDRLSELLEECERANGGEPITFFEITTCAAFLAFAREPADAVLLETGLGGRLDATNVVPRPAATAITRISIDHTQFLGDTIAAIAGEKAGIMKPGVPVVVGPQASREAVETFRAAAGRTGAALRLFGPDWRTIPLPDGFRYDGGRSLVLPAPALPGVHQIGNAGTAIACLEHLDLPVPDAAVAAGLRGVEWPGRLQRLTRGPLAESLPSGWELWLDGGHNDSAGEVLAAQAARWAQADRMPLDLVFGMLANRRPSDMLRPLAPFAERLRAVAIPDEPGSLSAEAAADDARTAGLADAAPAAGLAEALAELARSPGPRRILVCGSLYLAGRVLARNG
jgi:dihydrofolate synthase/folylpolyglutamate synthase